MKRLSFMLAATLILTGCGSTSVTYKLTLAQGDAELQKTLAEESLRVIERRVEAKMDSLTDKQIMNEGTDGYSIRISVENGSTVEELSADLAEPFSLEIMSEVPEDKADIVVEGHGGFLKTGVNQDDLEWAQSREEPGTGKGEVRLIFTDAGREKMGKLFKEMKGKNIAIFVRNILVSKLLVETGELKDDIIIHGIPDVELAQAFSEDVNVGINVTFTPVAE